MNAYEHEAGRGQFKTKMYIEKGTGLLIYMTSLRFIRDVTELTESKL